MYVYNIYITKKIFKAREARKKKRNIYKKKFKSDFRFIIQSKIYVNNIYIKYIYIYILYIFIPIFIIYLFKCNYLFIKKKKEKKKKVTY